jgi:hypothetical protein
MQDSILHNTNRTQVVAVAERSQHASSAKENCVLFRLHAHCHYSRGFLFCTAGLLVIATSPVLLTGGLLSITRYHNA